MIITNHHTPRDIRLMYSCHTGGSRIDYFYSLDEARDHCRIYGGWIKYPAFTEETLP